MMTLGAFSVSLSVKDIAASRSFYENLGFKVFGGDQAQNWLMMQNGEHVIGLFQGMFEGNLLTFNPGWDQHCNTLGDFADVRTLAKDFEAKGLKVENATLENPKGPGSFTLSDPDGNVILIDQHC